jgi:hypothetical protein
MQKARGEECTVHQPGTPGISTSKLHSIAASRVHLSSRSLSQQIQYGFEERGARIALMIDKLFEQPSGFVGLVDCGQDKVRVEMKLGRSEAYGLHYDQPERFESVIKSFLRSVAAL